MWIRRIVLVLLLIQVLLLFDLLPLISTPSSFCESQIDQISLVDNQHILVNDKSYIHQWNFSQDNVGIAIFQYIQLKFSNEGSTLKKVALQLLCGEYIWEKTFYGTKDIVTLSYDFQQPCELVLPLSGLIQSKNLNQFSVQLELEYFPKTIGINATIHVNSLNLVQINRIPSSQAFLFPSFLSYHLSEQISLYPYLKIRVPFLLLGNCSDDTYLQPSISISTTIPYKNVRLFGTSVISKKEDVTIEWTFETRENWTEFEAEFTLKEYKAGLYTISTQLIQLQVRSRVPDNEQLFPTFPLPLGAVNFTLGCVLFGIPVINLYSNRRLYRKKVGGQS